MVLPRSSKLVVMPVLDQLIQHSWMPFLQNCVLKFSLLSRVRWHNPQILHHRIQEILTLSFLQHFLQISGPKFWHSSKHKGFNNLMNLKASLWKWIQSPSLQHFLLICEKRSSSHHLMPFLPISPLL
uniref:E3 ubiquitin-protein ligase UPL2 n=1 Tax=Rhizophora mucronata TaxID=61149 RepID=A0A2P2MUW3_RHIMU